MLLNFVIFNIIVGFALKGLKKIKGLFEDENKRFKDIDELIEKLEEISEELNLLLGKQNNDNFISNFTYRVSTINNKRKNKEKLNFEESLFVFFLDFIPIINAFSLFGLIKNTFNLMIRKSNNKDI